MCWSSKILVDLLPAHAGIKGNGRAYRLVGKATSTGALFLGRAKVLRSLRHYLRTQSREDYAIDRLEERDVRRGSADDLPLEGWGRAVVNQSNILLELRNGVEAYLGLFWMRSYQLDPKWNKLSVLVADFSLVTNVNDVLLPNVVFVMCLSCETFAIDSLCLKLERHCWLFVA